MKWFIVMMAMVNGQTTIWVEDNRPFDTPTQCEAERLSLVSDYNKKPHINPTVRILCGGNNVVASFVTGYQGN